MEKNNYRKYREKNHYHQKAAAKALNVSQTSISNWERGATDPPLIEAGD